jgi:YVTN family beta-propeller protein
MRHFLMATNGLTEDEAISLMSVAVDFGVTQVVDGNWGVHAILKKAIFAVYVANSDSNDDSVSVIDAATNMVIGSPIMVGADPQGVAVTPDGRAVYVANKGSNTTSVIDTGTNLVIATVSVGANPVGVAVTLNGSKVYVTNQGLPNTVPSTVSVIDTATNMVTSTILLGVFPLGVSLNPVGVSVTPDGSKVYIANFGFGTGSVSVIDTTTNTVSGTILSSGGPASFGVFIQPQPRFAGTPGKANCYGQSVAALTSQYGGLNAAAAALRFSSAAALQKTILGFCGG